MRFELYLDDTIFIEAILLYAIFLLLVNYYPYMQLSEHQNSQKATIALSLFVLASLFIIKLVLKDFDNFHTLLIIIFISNTVISFVHLKNTKFIYFWKIIGKENNKKFTVIFHYLITVIAPMLCILTFTVFDMYNPIVQNIQILIAVIGIISTLDGIYTGGSEDIESEKEYRLGIIYIVTIYIVFFGFSINDYKANSSYGEKILTCGLLFETTFIVYLICELNWKKNEIRKFQSIYEKIIQDYKDEIRYLKTKDK